ncbi:MAG TPA: hypothetical protein VIH57_24115 [Bacteroidales bacterium]
MNPLEKYNIKDESGIHYKSKILNIAFTLRMEISPSDPDDRNNFKLDFRINELMSSLFNQWQFVIETYQRLHYLFTELNKYSNVLEPKKKITDYDFYSLKHELDFRDYSYLFIISLKTYLDMFACLIDIIINQQVRNEQNLPDLWNLGKKIDSVELNSEINKLKDKTLYPWIFCIKETRDRLIHRGYLLKLNNRLKSENLIIQVFHGIDFSPHKELINIGDLFDSFMLDMPLIEEKISNILIEEVELLKDRHIYEKTYSFGDLVNDFIYNDKLKITPQ